jgi:NAD-dependent dihydropyrimidine dehydrogenase PreA subunit
MPEPKVKIIIDYKRCDPQKCDKGICAAVLACPNKLLKQFGAYEYPYLVPGFCQECGKCTDSCLWEAIRML